MPPGGRRVNDDRATTLARPGVRPAGAVPRGVPRGAAGPALPAGAPGRLVRGAGGGPRAPLAAVNQGAPQNVSMIGGGPCARPSVDVPDELAAALTYGSLTNWPRKARAIAESVRV